MRTLKVVHNGLSSINGEVLWGDVLGVLGLSHYAAGTLRVYTEKRPHTRRIRIVPISTYSVRLAHGRLETLGLCKDGFETATRIKVKPRVLWVRFTKERVQAKQLGRSNNRRFPS